jgi:D-amino-acid oxidase
MEQRRSNGLPALPRLSRRAALRATAGSAAVAALGRVHRAEAGAQPSVGVVGAGVVGLNVARIFVEHGYSVTVYAANVSPGTTSDIAPAVMFPHLIPATSVMTDAARRTNAYYSSFLGSGMGVTNRRTLILSDTPDLDPDIAPWGPAYGGITPLAPGDVPPGFAYGWTFQTLFVDTRVFMPYFLQLLLSAGATVTLRKIGSRNELLALPHSIIANCTGLGAAELVPDDTVYPFRGQLVTVTPQPLADLVVHGSDYVFTRGDSAILGGTNDAHETDVTPSEAVTEGIVDRNKSVVPTLSRDQVTNVRVGLRPFREDGPRLEVEAVGDKLLLHNYGHGGGGWSLAPGCAEILYAMLPSTYASNG